MGVKTMGPPETLVSFILERFSPTVFVETGTYRGDTAAWAAARFQHVYTIEAARPAFESAASRHAGIANISFLHGMSPDVLPEILARIDADAVFWLDAHWMGLDSYGRDHECPVLAELSLINSSPHTHFIMIDDARLFLAPPPMPHDPQQWPTIAEVLAELGRKPRYTVVIDDVIVSVPLAARAQVCREVQRHTTQAWRGATSGPSLLQRLVSGWKRG